MYKKEEEEVNINPDKDIKERRIEEDTTIQDTPDNLPKVLVKVRLLH